MLELPYWEYSGVVVDLTYSPENLEKLNMESAYRHLRNPEKYPIRINSFGNREHHNLQRRLKYRLDKAGKPFSLMTAPEYGEKKGRLHVHAIILGLNMSDQRLIFDAWGNAEWQAFDIKPLLDPEQIYYQTKYVTKGADPKLWERDHPYQEAPKIRTGNGYREDGKKVRTGHGYQYAMDNRHILNSNRFIRFRGKEQTLPRYIVDTAGIEFSSKDFEDDFQERENQYVALLERFKKKNDRHMSIDEKIKFWQDQKLQKILKREAIAFQKDPSAWKNLVSQRLGVDAAYTTAERAAQIRETGLGEAKWLEVIESLKKEPRPTGRGHPPPLD